MTSVKAFQALADAIIPYLSNPPILPSIEQQNYLAASLDFAYTAVELVEAQLERRIRAAQEGLKEISQIDRQLILLGEQEKADENSKATRCAEMTRVVEHAERLSMCKSIKLS
ncbi:hypothetical protein H0H81_000949 [Sphagnurus paluster]|uniref:Uncharacterized protein n=1 Tax=Sphagnurus paluster TaxID=117069 RepID=A0A9P7KFA0_9AGAR|nr:hypothetical protein H0H81_000949 [Sphagnurus paluster]